MRLFVTRHGITNYNERGLCNDDPQVDVHLTDEGIGQAKSLGDKLSKFQIDVAYISNLPRTRETAKLILEGRSVRIIEDARINDRKTGFEGRPVKDFLECIREDIIHFKPTGGESFAEEKTRVHAFLADLLNLDYESVLIVTHSEIARIILGYFGKLNDIATWGLAINHCEVFQINSASV